MKILYVISGMGAAAGTSVFAGEVASELARQGHELAIACSNYAKEGRYPVDPRVEILSISSALERGGWDVAHIHALWEPVLHFAARALRNAGVRIVWSPHGMLTEWAMNNRKWKKLIAWHLYQKRDLARADVLHATAQDETADIRRMGLANKVEVVPLGVETPKGEPPAKHGGKYILYLGRIQRKKGLANLVEAWAATHRTGWRIVVAGPDQENHTAELKALARERNVAGSIEFKGAVFAEEKAALYRDARFFVLPTFSENFGSVVLEALAQGTPVVCTKGAPWPQLEAEHCGEWIDIGAEALAASLVRMMDCGDEKLTQMGRNGRALAMRAYTWPAVAKRMLQAYGE
ncbi:MAG: glycosyltransferase [Kiritimatiellae bacterium]|nr:glycosyltransferase [Kiritimatiellia bacterium]